MQEAEHNLLLVSDLHLSEGFLPRAGKWALNEDFLSDEAFAAFLFYHDRRRLLGRPWKLIIAGDVFDFLQVTSRPAVDVDELALEVQRFAGGTAAPLHKVVEPAARRAQALAALDQAVVEVRPASLGGHAGSLAACAVELKRKAERIADGFVWDLERLATELRILASKTAGRLSDNDRSYGLGTSAQEAVWKLDRIAEGHPVFFSALAWFIAQGNSVVLMKGNHDVELHWPEVRQRLRLFLADAYAYPILPDPPFPADGLRAARDAAAFLAELDVRLSYSPWIYFEPGLLYLEHGNQYFGTDAFADFLNPILPQNPRLIRLPSGSFFVRYFFNKVEQSFPFVDNLRPLSRPIAWAFEHRFFETAGLLWQYKGGLWRFLQAYVGRGRSDAALDRETQRVRKILGGEAAQPSPAQAGRAGEAAAERDFEGVQAGLRGERLFSGRRIDERRLRTILAGEREHESGLEQSAEGPLTETHLREIEALASQERSRLARRIGAWVTLMFPILLSALIALGALAILGAPLAIAGLWEETAAFVTGNYVVWLAVSTGGTFVVKQLLARRMRRWTEGADPLWSVAPRLWEILCRPSGASAAPRVRYLVFGHTHDPDVRRLGAMGDGPWFVNTGSWLQSVSEVEAWDRLERDYTFLQIVPGVEEELPRLFRWNPATNRPERLRRRAEEVGGASGRAAARTSARGKGA